MAGITFTQTDLDNLKEALVSGASEVQIGDKKITYRSQKEIKDLIKEIETKLNSSTSTSVVSNVVGATFKKGNSC